MTASNRIFIVLKEDTVVQVTGYIVRAKNQDHARSLVDGGFYIEETATETIDNLSSETVSVAEINPNSEGQLR